MTARKQGGLIRSVLKGIVWLICAGLMTAVFLVALYLILVPLVRNTSVLLAPNSGGVSGAVSVSSSYIRRSKDASEILAPAPEAPPEITAERLRKSKAVDDSPAAPQKADHDIQKPADKTPGPLANNQFAFSNTQQNLAILQIGDSHTSADFFSGELRKQLQARFGDGGAGYIAVGNPRTGVRNSIFDIETSAGWTYHSIQKSESSTEFWLSGFNAVTSAAGESITFSAEHSQIFDVVEIELIRQPGGGAIDIELNGVVQNEVDLAAEKPERIVVRLIPDGKKADRVSKMKITTKRNGLVSVGSLAVFRKTSGLSYSSVGYPGATVTIVNKFEPSVFSFELQHLDPQIVVLAFGTNEGFDENLDLNTYAKNFEDALHKIESVLPLAAIVMILPPDAGQSPPDCQNQTDREGCGGKEADSNDAATKPDDASCRWKRPPSLDGVREVQREIAKRHNIAYWNWAEIMPPQCGPDQWVSANPALMTKDHVHFTQEGYRLSAEKFAERLIPIIENLQARSNVIPYN
jgi:lysophospholipase L1-like esterase